MKEQLKESISGFQDKIEQIAKETAEKVASTMPAPALPNFADENKGKFHTWDLLSLDVNKINE